MAIILSLIAGVGMLYLDCFNNILQPTPTYTPKEKRVTVSLIKEFGIDRAVGLYAASDKYFYYTIQEGGTNRGGVGVIDISDPANPKETFFKDEMGFNRETSAILIKGNYLYLAGLDVVLFDEIAGTIIDVSDPANLKIAGGFATNGSVDDIEMVGNCLYVLGKGLTIDDISDPTNTKLMSRIEDNSIGVNDVFVEDDRAYITGRGLAIVDISDKERPFVIGKIEDDETAMEKQVFVSRDVIYLIKTFFKGSSRTTLNLFDASDPKNIKEIKVFDKEYDSLDLYSDKYLFASHKDGYSFFDISDPRNPVLLQDLPNNFTIGTVQGNYIYSIEGNPSNSRNSILKIYEIKYE